jgi:hypothetical protein
MVTEKDVFFNIQQKMASIPFCQSVGWHDFRLTIRGSCAVYFVDDIKNPSICAWGLVRNIPLIGKIIQVNGESYNQMPSKVQIKEFYEQIALYSKHHYLAVHVSSIGLYDVNYEIGIRQAGFVRPLIIMDCPLSTIIDLQTWKPSSKWRYQVKEAQKQNLSFVYIENPTEKHAELVYAMYKEMTHEKGMRNKLESNSLQILLSNNNFKLFMISTCDGQPIAACIVYVHEKKCYYPIAATFNAAKRINGSSRFMVNSLFEWLKIKGVEFFDFGRIGPGKRSSNSVYEFKSYAGGDVVSYNGEWVFSNNIVLESILYFTLNLKIKRW